MKKAVYILTSLLAAAYTILLAQEAIKSINDVSLITFHEDMFWLSIVTFLIAMVTSLAFMALSMIQLTKSTPKLILIFSGYAFFSSTGFIFTKEWWYPFIYLIAGLLPAVYEFIKHGRLVKKTPLQLQRYDGMLIAAGVLSCICIAFHIYGVISDMQFYKRFGTDFPAASYYFNVIGIIQCIFIGLFSFLKCRRTSVLYRLYFTGSSAIGFLLFSINIIDTLIRASKADYFYVDPLRVIGSAVPFVLAAIILIHAFRTRRDILIPQEHIEAALQAEIPIS